MMKKITLLSVLLLSFCACFAQPKPYKERDFEMVLTSKDGHGGGYAWKMRKAGDVTIKSEDISKVGFDEKDWLPAIVPGTVLNSLVYNKVYPEPYFGINNRIKSKQIPDIAEVGRDFYTYWFRTEFDTPTDFEKKKVWLQVDGINYRAEIWLNGKMVGNIAGMFYQDFIDITDWVKVNGKNALAVKTIPVDVPGTADRKSWGATGEYRNGGNGEIGYNTTMLMTVGWDFTFQDGIRDRNTGIWKDISVFTTWKMALRHPFVKSELSKPSYNRSRQTVSVQVVNSNYGGEKCTVVGEIKGTGIKFEKDVQLYRGEIKEVVFTPEAFPQLVIDNPRLWWPINKGKQEMYELELKVYQGKDQLKDTVRTRFGIREITSDQNTPDKSRQFYVNGKPIFIRGTNWIPETMLRNSDERTYAELRYTAQSGVNLVRFWAGGITESDYFFQLCDELGILVWTEFWMTGDTKHVHDVPLYMANVESTVKRIRNHPSLAYYVGSNESTDVAGIREFLFKLDGTRGYQMQSECDGVHDGSPYKTVNPMRYYENTASDRGSRVDGFNPEYGTPCLPTVEMLREMMPEKDLWPINKEVWDYMDGGGFHLMSSLYKDLVNQYGESKSIDEFAMKAQFVGAMGYRGIWEVWNYNKLNYGDRYCSGLLYWYHNSPARQVCGRMWDWSLEPTAALYYSQNALQPLHAQFDYLKNTVSVVNDYYKAFTGYKVSAEVYDLDMKKVFGKEVAVSLPEDGVANDVIKIDFPADITKVHFIKLKLFDEAGKEVSDSFYWRSTNEYKGPKTVTGPATAGFEDLKLLKPAKLDVEYKTKEKDGKFFIQVNLENTGQSLAFFTQLQWLDEKGSPVRPSFYTDNFMCLLPGESKSVIIETDMAKLPGSNYNLVVKGFNLEEKRFSVKVR